MKRTALQDHNFLKSVTKIVTQYIARCGIKADLQPPSNAYEAYAIESLLSIGEVTSCIDQLYMAVDSLGGFRASSRARKVDRFNHIVFSIENYYLRLTSVHDRCLRLTNIIFQLGLAERECRDSTVTKNYHVLSTSVSKALKQLGDFIQPFRRQRNTVAHNASYSEHELNQLGSFFYLLDEGESDVKKFRHRFKVRTDRYISGRKKEFNGQILKVEELVAKLFDALVSEFQNGTKAG